MIAVKVNVEGYGTFEVDYNRVSSLLSWLSANKAVDVTPDNVVREVDNSRYTGNILLNENHN